MKIYLAPYHPCPETPITIEAVDMKAAATCSTCHQVLPDQGAKEAFEAGEELGHWLWYKAHGQYFDGVLEGMRAQRKCI